MNTIAILPESGEQRPTTFRAITTGRKATGRTLGEALDALTSQLGVEKTGVAVVVQHFRPDEHFSAEQRDRLSKLMARWRSARDTGESLPSAEQADLERLVAEELEGVTERAAQISHELETARRRGLDQKRVRLLAVLELEKRRDAQLLPLSGLIVINLMVFIILGATVFSLISPPLRISVLIVVAAANIIVELLLYWRINVAYKRVKNSLTEAIQDLLEDSADSVKREEKTVAR
jgi:hypothetical protein